jgi:TPR repeat protein
MYDSYYEGGGEGVKKDAVQAVHWYRKAAEQGYAQAQCNLGVMYANGLGVEKDAVQAVHWFRKAAEQGHAQAQHNLGVLIQICTASAMAFSRA